MSNLEGSSGEGSFDRLQGSPSQKLPADSHFSSLFMNQRPKWQNYSNCWTGSTQNVQRVGVLKCAMTSWDLWRILWSVTTWYCGPVYPPTTTWWYILVHLLDIEAHCNTEIHHWDTRMLKKCQCDNLVMWWYHLSTVLSGKPKQFKESFVAHKVPTWLLLGKSYYDWKRNIYDSHVLHTFRKYGLSINYNAYF